MKNFARIKFNSWKKEGPPLKKEDGIALVMSLLFLVLLALLAIVSINIATTDSQRTAVYKKSKDAFFMADAGIEHAKSLIQSVQFDDILDGDDDIEGTADDGLLSGIGGSVTIGANDYSQTSFNNGTYSVRVYDNDDGDSNLNDDSDGVVSIESIGASKGRTKTIVAMVRKFYLEAEDFPAAVTLADDEADIDMNSNAFEIDGNGWIRGTSPPNVDKPVDDPTCADKPGLATNDSSPNTDYSPANAENKIVGSGGTGDILTGDTTFTLVALQEIRNTFLSVVDVTYNGSQNLSGVTLGTPGNPQITYFDDSVNFTGNVDGAGVLIVNKDFKISGSFIFEGIILIGICDTCPGRLETGLGGATIFGAIVVSNPTSSFSDEARIKMTGNAEIYYSCSAIENGINTGLNKTFSTVSWSG